MKQTVDYSKSPAAAFDAIEDIKNWLGSPEKFTRLSQQLQPITNTEQFAFYVELCGVSGFPVKAWYEHIHGQGSWEKANVPS